MKTIQFVETTRDHYIAHVRAYRDGKHGIRHVNVLEVETEPYTQEKVYQAVGVDPYVAMLGQHEKWTLIAFGLFNKIHPEHTQYFILEEVTMGVTSKQIGLNGEEENLDFTPEAIIARG